MSTAQLARVIPGEPEWRRPEEEEVKPELVGVLFLGTLTGLSLCTRPDFTYRVRFTVEVAEGSVVRGTTYGKGKRTAFSVPLRFFTHGGEPSVDTFAIRR